MRKLLIPGTAFLMLALFGCGSNPAGSIVGPSPTPQLKPPPPVVEEFDWQDEYIGPPVFINLESVVPPGAQASFGEISNLSAGGFTLTRLDGQSFEVVTNAETKVLSGGELSGDLGLLGDGLSVTVFGMVRGQPGEAPITAAVIVVSGANFKSKGGFWVD